MHNLLFCAHTLCMNYVTNTFLLVSSSVRSKQLLCFVHGQGQKREQKPTTKKIVGFHNHSPLLTMVLHLLHSVIDAKFSRHFFNQSEVGPKSIVARASTFSRALCRLRVITSSFDWFTGLSPSFLIGQSNYFGFGVTTLI